MPSWVRSILIGILVTLSIALGVYVGFWVMFIGGIVQIVEAVKDVPVNAWGIGFGILRILGAGLVGWLTFLVTALVTWVIAKITE